MSEAPKTISEQVLAALDALNKISPKRFILPWRWSQWSQLYSQVLEQWAYNQIDISEEPKLNIIYNDDGITDEESDYRTLQCNKLTNRLEKAQHAEHNLDRYTLGLKPLTADEADKLKSDQEQLQASKDKKKELKGKKKKEKVEK